MVTLKMLLPSLHLQYKPPLPRKKSGQNGEGGHTPVGASVVAKNSNFSATYTVSSPPDGGGKMTSKYRNHHSILMSVLLQMQQKIQCQQDQEVLEVWLLQGVELQWVEPQRMLSLATLQAQPTNHAHQVNQEVKLVPFVVRHHSVK